MALIAALLQTYRRKVENADARDILADVAHRVRAVGAAHALLRDSARVAELDLRTYIADLCQGLQALAPIDRDIVIAAHVDEGSVSLATAVPLGLIVNELVTNSLKHAFDRGLGEIAVRIELMDGHGKLMVADDGLGLKPARPGSAGLEMVARLVDRLGGDLRVEQAVERAQAPALQQGNTRWIQGSGMWPAILRTTRGSCRYSLRAAGVRRSAVRNHCRSPASRLDLPRIGTTAI